MTLRAQVEPIIAVGGLGDRRRLPAASSATSCSTPAGRRSSGSTCPMRVWLPRLSATHGRRLRGREELVERQPRDAQRSSWERRVPLLVFALRSHFRRRREYPAGRSRTSGSFASGLRPRSSGSCAGTRATWCSELNLVRTAIAVTSAREPRRRPGRGCARSPAASPRTGRAGTTAPGRRAHGTRGRSGGSRRRGGSRTPGAAAARAARPPRATVAGKSVSRLISSFSSAASGARRRAADRRSLGVAQDRRRCARARTARSRPGSSATSRPPGRGRSRSSGRGRG